MNSNHRNMSLFYYVEGKATTFRFTKLQGVSYKLKNVSNQVGGFITFQKYDLT